MLLQIAIGAALIVASTLIAAIGFAVMEAVLSRYQSWLLKPSALPKTMLLMCVAVLWILLIITAVVWMWAGVFLWLEIFVTVEAAIYFSIVSFTTLGFGDILLPQEWRLLSGMTAINGLLMIGLQTAMLIEVLRRVRAIQSERRDS